MGEDYVDTTLAPQPTSNVVFVTDATSAQGASETPSSPLDVTMLAMLGLTMAGAGVMKSESARKKQEELAKADALAEITLATALAEQKDSAEENWAENQTMQANAQQAVMTEVTQSDANRQFWADYAIWEQKVAEAEAKRQAEQHQTATSGMFPPGSTVEDLPPHLQKLFWELGNMHFEKDDTGDWRFADDRGELGYFQYLIRQALREGDNQKLTQHFQDANKYIDTTLLNWSDTELTEVREYATNLVTQKQNAIPNGNASNKRIELMVETNKGVVDVNHALQQKSLEIKQDFVERERQHLNTFVNTQVTEHQNIAHQAITTNMSQVAIRMQPPVTSGVVGGSGGVMPLHVTTPIIPNIINSIPLTLSSDALPVPPPPDTGNLIVMAGTTPEEIDTILATQYTHYLDTNYDVALTTEGASQWNATETYNVFLATENTAQALYYQAIQSGLLDLGMSRFTLDTLSPEQVFRNAIGHVDIRKIDSGIIPTPIRTQWDANNDNSTIFFHSGFDWAIPDSLQWAITREFGQILDHRSFNYGTSELQRNGIVHNNQIVSGFNNGAWSRSDVGMFDMSHVGGPSGMTNSANFTVNGIDPNAQDEWADMFAHWVNFTNFRMTQPYDLSEKELQKRFITDYLNIPSIDGIDLSSFTAQQLYHLSIHLEAGLNPNSPYAFDPNAPVDERLKLSLIRTINDQRPEYNRLVHEQMPTYFDRMARMDNWVSGSLFTANLWREPSFQDNLKSEILAIKQLDTITNTLIVKDEYGEGHTFTSIQGAEEQARARGIHSDVFTTFDDYATGINGINNLSPSGLRELYQDQRQLMLRILTATMGNEGVVGLDTGTYGNFNLLVSDAEIASTIPYAIHSLRNADLLNIIEIAKTFSPSLSTSETLHPAYRDLVNLFTTSPNLSQENYRDVTGQPIAGAPQATVPSNDWLADALLFTGALLFEPIDWAISGVEAVGHMIQGDFGSALGVATLALLPTALLSHPGVRRQIIPTLQGFYETGQQSVHDLYRIIRQSPDALMQGLRQLNNDADAFFNGTQNDRYFVTPDGFVLRRSDIPSNNVFRYSGDGGGGNPIGSNKPLHLTDDEWEFITTHYGDNTKIMDLATGDHYILRNLNKAQRAERLLLLDGTEEAIEIVTNQRYQAALDDYYGKVRLGMTPPRFPNREHIEHGVLADSKGFILESNVRKNLLGNGLKFIELKPGVHIYNDDMLRRHLGIKTSPCADFMVQNPNTGDFIIVESKASISEINHGVSQIRATFNATTNRYPIESAAIYTNQDTFDQLMSGRTGRYSLQAIEGNNQANTYHLIDTETGNPVRVSTNDANSPIITVIKITG